MLSSRNLFVSIMWWIWQDDNATTPATNTAPLPFVRSLDDNTIFNPSPNSKGLQSRLGRLQLIQEQADSLFPTSKIICSQAYDLNPDEANHHGTDVLDSTTVLFLIEANPHCWTRWFVNCGPFIQYLQPNDANQRNKMKTHFLLDAGLSQLRRLTCYSIFVPSKQSSTCDKITNKQYLGNWFAISFIRDIFMVFLLLYWWIWRKGSIYDCWLCA